MCHSSYLQIIYSLSGFFFPEQWLPISELSLAPAQKNMVVGGQVTFSLYVSFSALQSQLRTNATAKDAEP